MRRRSTKPEFNRKGAPAPETTQFIYSRSSPRKNPRKHQRCGEWNSLLTETMRGSPVVLQLPRNPPLHARIIAAPPLPPDPRTSPETFSMDIPSIGEDKLDPKGSSRGLCHAFVRPKQGPLRARPIDAKCSICMTGSQLLELCPEL
jgi:hypothetical protein